MVRVKSGAVLGTRNEGFAEYCDEPPMGRQNRRREQAALPDGNCHDRTYAGKLEGTTSWLARAFI